jgi:hypothetical protein
VRTNHGVSRRGYTGERGAAGRPWPDSEVGALVSTQSSHSVTQSLNGFLVAWLVLTVGQAIYLTVDIAIAAALVPDDV